MPLSMTRNGMVATASGDANLVTVAQPLVAKHTADPTWSFAASASATINSGAVGWEDSLRAQMAAGIDAAWADAKRAWQRRVYVAQTLTPQVDAKLAGLEE